MKETSVEARIRRELAEDILRARVSAFHAIEGRVAPLCCGQWMKFEGAGVNPKYGKYCGHYQCQACLRRIDVYPALDGIPI